MQIPKIVYLILLSLVLLVLMFDTYIYFSSIANFRDALDQALDAAIVTSMDVDENQRGAVKIKYKEAVEAARSCLRENLKLDNNLNNDFYSDSDFYLNIMPTGNMIEAKFSTRIHLICLKIIGLESVPYSISKTQDFFTKYV
jgi:hypothetical protein